MLNSAFCTEAKRCNGGLDHHRIEHRSNSPSSQRRIHTMSVGKEKLAGGKEPKDDGRIRGTMQLSRSYLN